MWGSSSSSSSSLDSGSSFGGGSQEDKAKQQIQQAMAQEYYTTLLENMRDQCYNKCIKNPSSSLSSSEQNCLAMCCDRYVESTSVVSSYLIQAGRQQ
mmetsp:Transcript_22299/g.26825  ORF Transcript_22299/g.26825 Transcript_22299/m.26825 type:complete len:97 (+) Transcript_22299:82-372(+)